MSQIDLKHCTLTLEDGYKGPPGQLKVNLTPPTGTPSVNNIAGYAIGSTTMLIDLVTGIIVNGSTFTTVGDVTVYTVTNHVETGGNTSSITFTPPLVVATVDDQVLTFVYMAYPIGTVTMIVTGVTGAVVNGDQFVMVGDNTVYTISAHTETSGATTSITFAPALVKPTSNQELITIQPHGLQAKLGEGTADFIEKRKMQYTLDRGLLASGAVREGDEEPMDVKFDFIWEHLKASGTDVLPTIEDVLKNRGLAATWVTSGADPCEPFSVDVLLEFVPVCAAESKEDIRFPEFRYEELNHQTKQGIVAVTGKCKSKQALITRGS